MTFRLNCKNFFLTYPQCDYSKDLCLENIRTFFTPEDIEFAVVAKERHGDGEPHLHAVVSLKQRRDIRNSRALDVLSGGKHGNYKSCRKLVAAVRYVTKDSDYVALNLNVDEYLRLASRKQNTKSAIVAGMLMDGNSLTEINQEMPGFVMMNLKKIQEYQAFLDLTRIRENLLGIDALTWEVLEGHYIRNEKQLPETHAEIMTWLLNSIGQPGRIGDKHLWVSGGTGLQKTSFFTRLGKFISIYWPPRNEDFYNNYSDDAYDLVVFDEFKANKDIQFMNNFLDGSPMTLRTKGGQVVKKKRIPTVVLANFEVDELYRVGGDMHAFESAAIKRRFLEITINRPLEMLSDDNLEPVPAEEPDPEPEVQQPQPMVIDYETEETEIFSDSESSTIDYGLDIVSSDDSSDMQFF